MGQRALQVQGRRPQAAAVADGAGLVGRRDAGGRAARGRLLRGLAARAHHVPDVCGPREEDPPDDRGAGEADDPDRRCAGHEHRYHDEVRRGAAQCPRPHQERKCAEVLAEAAVRRVHDDRRARRLDPRRDPRRHRSGRAPLPGAGLRPPHLRLPNALSRLPGSDQHARARGAAAGERLARGSECAMKTTTTTQTTHYEVQKKRRESLLDEWKGYHKTILKRKDVVMHDVPSRRIRSGVYAGWDADRPTKNLDATVHELAPHTMTTVHRHSW